MAKNEQNGVKKSYTMFAMSSPGYYFPEVEATIAEYKKALSDLNELNLQYESTIAQLNNKITELEQQLTNQAIMMQSIDAASRMSEEEARVYMDDFSREIKRDTREVEDDFEETIQPVQSQPKKRKLNIIG